MANKITNTQLSQNSILELRDLITRSHTMIAKKQGKATITGKGRRGVKIYAAFKAIPSEPVLAEEFCKQHDISLHTLRQVKRFDETGLKEPVFVRQLIKRGDLYVWRGAEDLPLRMMKK
ncbi:MAG: hypothetical protein ACI9XC_002697 [Gammaproteobacteria bacterium]|jgi:hypothetical protein